jgi:hypothetical protein
MVSTLPYIFIANCYLCGNDTDGNEWDKLKTANGNHPCPFCGSAGGWTWKTKNRVRKETA